ncbi:MAG: hypothetical protein OXC19_17570 [Bryobacterales bacterium]|nr:hypothetical protein [Bryobacterales bacterium]
MARTRACEETCASARRGKELLVRGPVHTSWLNQIEVQFSLPQCKAVMPNDFASCDEPAVRLRSFERLHRAIAELLDWMFTRKDLQQLLKLMRASCPVLPPRRTIRE